MSIIHEFWYDLPELAVTGLKSQFRLGDSTNRLSIFSSGDEVYRENRLLIAHSRSHSILNFDLAISLNQIAIKNYSSRMRATSRVALVALGIFPATLWAFSAGAYINVWKSDYSRHPIHKIWFTASSFIRTQTAVCASFDYNSYGFTTFSLGMQERVNDLLTLRVSAADKPASLGAAIILNHKRLEFDISVASTPPLGWINRAGITFR